MGMYICVRVWPYIKFVISPYPTLNLYCFLLNIKNEKNLRFIAKFKSVFNLPNIHNIIYIRLYIDDFHVDTNVCNLIFILNEFLLIILIWYLILSKI